MKKSQNGYDNFGKKWRARMEKNAARKVVLTI